MISNMPRRIDLDKTYDYQWDEQKDKSKNYGVFAYCKTIGETVRLDEAIQMANLNWDLGELRIVEYASHTTWTLKGRK